MTQATAPKCPMCELYEKGYSDEEWQAMGCPNHTCAPAPKSPLVEEFVLEQDDFANKKSTHLVAVGDPNNGYEQDTEFNEEQFEDIRTGYTEGALNSSVTRMLEEALAECTRIKEPTPSETFRRISNTANKALGRLAELREKVGK